MVKIAWSEVFYSKRWLENRYGIPPFLNFEEDSLIPFFGKNQLGDIWAYAIVHGPELATSPSSFHLSLVISLLYVDLARIMDDFSRPLYSWRTPVLGPPDIVANLTGSRKLLSPPLQRPFNLPLFLRIPVSIFGGPSSG